MFNFSQLKQVKNGLIGLGYNQEKFFFTKSINEKRLSISFSTSLFGKVKMINFTYFFDKDLPEELHDKVFEKASVLIKNLNCEIEISSLSFEYIEASMFVKPGTNISAENLDKILLKFSKDIVPLCEQYLN